jgi:hypothetical protein
MKSSYAKLNLVATLQLFFIATFSFSQNGAENTVYSNRYRLNLPKEWIKKSKVMKSVTEILPQTIDELKDLDFCTKGKSKYIVHLLFDSISITNQQTSLPIEIGGRPHYTFSFDYSFYSALVVTDTLGKPLTMLRLNSPEEINTYSKNLSMAPQNVIYEYESIYNAQGRQLGRRVVQNVKPVTTNMPKHNASSLLTTDFLLRICEIKIYETEKLLKNLSVQSHLP